MMDVPLTLTSVLDRAGRLFADIEIVSRRPDRSLHRATYRDFVDRSLRLANAIVAAGLRPGDRVATLMCNHLDHLATYFGVPVGHQRDWNPKVPQKFQAGQKLKVYTDPKAPPPSKAVARGGSSGKAALPEFHVRPGGYEVGRPNRGHLVNGVQLPASDMVRMLDPDKCWGASHTIENLLAPFSDRVSSLARRDASVVKSWTTRRRFRLRT